MFPKPLLKLAEEVLSAARDQHLRLATAESCTGGLIAGCLTEIPGASDVLDRGLIVYSNEAKTDLLGVPADVIARCGAVSEDVARAMATGVLANAPVQRAVAVTGVAGPGGGSMLKPVGLVFVAAAGVGRETCCEEWRFGKIARREIRLNTIEASLRLLRKLL